MRKMRRLAATPYIMHEKNVVRKKTKNICQNVIPTPKVMLTVGNSEVSGKFGLGSNSPVNWLLSILSFRAKTHRFEKSRERRCRLTQRVLLLPAHEFA